MASMYTVRQHLTVWTNKTVKRFIKLIREIHSTEPPSADINNPSPSLLGLWLRSSVTTPPPPTHTHTHPGSFFTSCSQGQKIRSANHMSPP